MQSEVYGNRRRKEILFEDVERTYAYKTKWKGSVTLEVAARFIVLIGFGNVF